MRNIGHSIAFASNVDADDPRIVIRPQTDRRPRRRARTEAFAVHRSRNGRGCVDNDARHPTSLIDHLARFRGLYEAFNRRDIDRVLEMMSDDVERPNAWKGGRLVGRDAVREYWTAQWSEIDPHVEPESVTERGDGSLAVAGRQLVRSPDGELLADGEVVHVYRLADGLILRMDVEEPER